MVKNHDIKFRTNQEVASLVDNLWKEYHFSLKKYAFLEQIFLKGLKVYQKEAFGLKNNQKNEKEVGFGSIRAKNP